MVSKDANASIRAEARYLASYVVILLVICGIVVSASAIGHGLHLPVIATTALAFAGLLAAGYLSLHIWLQRKALAPLVPGPSPPLDRRRARFAPVAVQCVWLSLSGWALVDSLPFHLETRWHYRVDSFVMLCLSTSLAGYFAIVSIVRSRESGPTTISADARRRSDEVSAALALPDEAQRRFAMRPLVRRGYIRLGLIAAYVVSIFALAPLLGVAAAVLIGLAIFAAVFIFGIRFFDL